MNRQKMGLIAATLSAATMLSAPVIAEPVTPNFVMIYTDDLGYGDIGAYGANDIATPNIDAMADNGVKFTNFYTPSSVCSPSRAGMLTGRYPSRLGIGHVFMGNSPDGMALEEITLAEQLDNAGYTSALIGKWHLGSMAPYLPWNQGFDEFQGVLYSNDIENFFFYDNQIQIEEPIDQRYLTRRYTEQAVDFIGENKDDPFFLYLAHNMPHVPLYVSPEFEGKSERGLYGDTIQEIDWSVGQVLQALEDNGIADNTLVVFTSDNGPWLAMREDGGSAGGLRDGKMNTFDGGQKVPAVAYWPGTITPRIDDRMASMLDWFPTMSKLAGLPLPDDRVIDGQVITERLTGKDPEQSHEPFIYISGISTDAVAIRDGDWKLKLPQSGYPRFLEPIIKLGIYSHSQMLFNLKEDPQELNNLIDQYPEKVAELKAKLDDFSREMDEANIKPRRMRKVASDHKGYSAMFVPLGLLALAGLFLFGGLIYGAVRLVRYLKTKNKQEVASDT